MRLNDGQPACGAGKAHGGYCESPFRYANGRCKKHGGPSLKAAASPSYKDGHRSKFNPKGNVLDRYEAGLDDPELTHHRDAIALVDALAQDVLERWEEGGTPELWKRLKEAFDKQQVARRVRDTPKFNEATAEMELILERGSDQSQREEKVVRLLEASRRHRDSETKRKLSEAMMFATYEEAVAFYRALGEVVAQHVEDEETLRAIQDQMAAIVGRRRGLN
jgi:hypothetical protein